MLIYVELVWTRFILFYFFWLFYFTYAKKGENTYASHCSPNINLISSKSVQGQIGNRHYRGGIVFFSVLSQPDPDPINKA